jgi:CBS-domain-containing membrane protein
VLALIAGIDLGTEWIADVPSLFAVYAAVGVGLSMLAMAATNTEPPPAAGTALGVVAHGFDWELIIFVGTAVIMLVALHRVFRSRMTNLLMWDAPEAFTADVLECLARASWGDPVIRASNSAHYQIP